MQQPIILPWKGVRPTVAADAFIAPNATLIGDLVIGARSSIWFNVVMRADVNYIRVGERTNIQDGTIVHVATNDGPTLIGNDVLIGHAAIIHGCTLEDGCFVGMAATVMDDAVVEAGAMVAAGALVGPGKRVPKGQLWAGTPAKFMRELKPDEIASMKVQTGRYADLADAYRAMIAAETRR
ncbi:MAG: gamma carbonic anhydrase family protein [Rhodospirillaceae bacterium]|nr:gamma carbonic anhydrase family protein [Rhodospirillaceae bacterium]